MNMNDRSLKTMPLISGIIIARDAEQIIKNCVKSLSFADEIVVVDNGSKDNTIEICRKLGCKVYEYGMGSYPDWRNFGREKATGRYLIYLDTDEVIDEGLKEEVKKHVSDWPTGIACFAIPRKNIIFGKWLKHGGWYPDYVIRLFDKKHLFKWENELHEQPKFTGELGYLKSPIIHYKENTLSQMLTKTNKWSEVEAKLMYDSNHPSMTVGRFLSAIVREFFYRFVKKSAFLDGGEGIVMGIYQVYSRFISYAKLWEMQLKSAGKIK